MVVSNHIHGAFDCKKSRIFFGRRIDGVAVIVYEKEAGVMGRFSDAALLALLRIKVENAAAAALSASVEVVETGIGQETAKRHLILLQQGRRTQLDIIQLILIIPQLVLGQLEHDGEGAWHQVDSSHRIIVQIPEKLLDIQETIHQDDSASVKKVGVAGTQTVGVI